MLLKICRMVIKYIGAAITSADMAKRRAPEENRPWNKFKGSVNDLLIIWNAIMPIEIELKIKATSESM